ncbi:MAG: hypothetical protein R6X08_04780 [Desulfosalsimonadaceae bacterium]
MKTIYKEAPLRKRFASRTTREIKTAELRTIKTKGSQAWALYTLDPAATRRPSIAKSNTAAITRSNIQHAALVSYQGRMDLRNTGVDSIG